MKLTTKLFNIVLIASTAFFTACSKDFLDTLPKGLIIAKNANDFRLLLDNADSRYTNNLAQSSGFVDVVSDDSQLDSVWHEWERERLHAKLLYAFEPEVWTPDGPSGDNVWKQNYYVSTLVSNVLDQIGMADDNVALQQQLIAEAKVHRAYAYLTLVNIYAKHYNISTAATDPGVPLIGNPAQLPSLERSSVQEIYDFVLAQLLESIDDLPEDVSQRFSHRPTKVAVYAILARTYLYMGNYQQALHYADRSLAIRDFLYNYNDIYTGTPSADNVVGISRTTDEEMLLFKTTTKDVSMDTYMKLDTATFNALYSGYTIVNDTIMDHHDLRRPLWFESFSANGRPTRGYVSYVFNDGFHRYSVDGAPVDYIAVATPEMYMVRAECNARLGNLEAAVDDLNILRQHRYKTGTYTNLSASDIGDQPTVLDEVLLERRRELYGQELRLFDVKRLGLPVQHLEPEGTNVAYQVPAGDPKLIWPVHYDYLELNPEIGQIER